MIPAPTDVHVILPSFLLSLSHTSHLSSLHLPLSLPLTSSSSTLSPPRLFISHGFFPHLFISPIDLFISHRFFPPCLFISLTSSSPQLIAPSISYLNSPLPTAPTIGDAMLEIFFCPYAPVVVCIWKKQFFPLLLFDSICGFGDMCYY